MHHHQPSYTQSASRSLTAPDFTSWSRSPISPSARHERRVLSAGIEYNPDFQPAKPSQMPPSTFSMLPKSRVHHRNDFAHRRKTSKSWARELWEESPIHLTGVDATMESAEYILINIVNSFSLLTSNVRANCEIQKHSAVTCLLCFCTFSISL